MDQIKEKTNGIKFVNEEEVENTLNNPEKSFDEKLDNILDNLPTVDTTLEDSVTVNVFSRNEIENVRELFKLFMRGEEVKLTGIDIKSTNGDLDFKMSKQKLELFGVKVTQDTNTK